MSKFTPLFIRGALSEERQAVREYEASHVGAPAVDHDSLAAFRERLRANAETFAREALMQYVTRKQTITGKPFGRRRSLQPAMEVPKAWSKSVQKLLQGGRTSWRSSLNWDDRSTSITMGCRPLLDESWGKRGPAICTTEGKV